MTRDEIDLVEISKEIISLHNQRDYILIQIKVLQEMQKIHRSHQQIEMLNRSLKPSDARTGLTKGQL
jgi:hypothetical protein